jgi:hypothetical protein
MFGSIVEGTAIGAAWFISWIAAIGLAFWLLSKSPKVPGMTPLAQAARVAMLLSAFVPCLFLDILGVLFWYGVYRFAIREYGDQAGLTDRLQNASFNIPTQPQQAESGQSSNNPFASMQAPAHQAPAAPTSAPHPQDPPAESSSNPFTDGQSLGGIPTASPPPLEGPKSPSPSENPFLTE